MRIEEKNGNLVIVDFDAIEAYRIACAIEREGISFYKKLAAKTQISSIKEALVFLLKEEQAHLEFFEKALFDLREKKEDISEDNDLLDSADYNIFKVYQSIPELEDILKDHLKAIRLGLAIENNSLRFYRACQGSVSSGESKKEIAVIIQEENKHKQLLEDILSNI